MGQKFGIYGSADHQATLGVELGELSGYLCNLSLARP